MTKQEKIAQIRSVRRRCRGPLTPVGRQVVAELLERGDTAAAARADRANRTGCGYDVNQLIVEGPWDGKPREVRCPKCGQTIRFTAPRFD